MPKNTTPDPKELEFLEKTKHFVKRFQWWWRDEPVKVFQKQFPRNALKRADFNKTFPTEADYAAYIKLIFTTEFEEGARLYEIGRRLGKLRGIGKVAGPPFPELSLEEMHHTANQFFPDKLGPEVSFVTPVFAAQSPVSAGWTRYLIATFNLRHSDKALIARFKKFLDSERLRLKMTRKPRSPGGIRTRSVSWRMVEMYDLKKHFDAHPKSQCPVTIEHSRITKMEKM